MTEEHDDELMPESAANPDATPYDQIDESDLARNLVPELRAWGRTDEPFDPDQMGFLRDLLGEMGVHETIFAKCLHRYAVRRQERRDNGLAAKVAGQ